jgi:peptidyl-prolyl cis-trans isomerase-like 2
LDNKHTVFGKVVKGLETLDIIERVPVDPGDRPKTGIHIVKMTVTADPFAQLLESIQQKDVVEADKQKRRLEVVCSLLLF